MGDKSIMVIRQVNNSMMVTMNKASEWLVINDESIMVNKNKTNE